MLCYFQKILTCILFRMSGVKTIWECNSPDSLLDQSARYCITHLDTLILSSKEDEDSLHLPMEIGEKLFQMAQEEGLDIDDKFAEIFRHLTRVRMVTHHHRAGHVSPPFVLSCYELA